MLTGLPIALSMVVASLAAIDAVSVSHHDDYIRAYEAADATDRMLLIACVPDTDGPLAQRWKKWVQSPEVRSALKGRYELALLSTTAPVPSGSDDDEDASVPLLEHSGFAHLHSQPGIIMIDLTKGNPKSYEKVVFLYPFRGRYHLTRELLLEALDLPSGTLTQRMLTFAVRVHNDDPVSADSRTLPLLTDAAESHSQYQADIRLQGHHHWNRRFQELLAELPGNVLPYEVCAESWPGETLIEAAHECVHSWRQSSGHWSRVAARTRYFAYDMKRGDNGIWYGTGILAIDREEGF